MERRDFMKLTGAAGAGAALAGNAGCLPGLMPRRVSQAEIDKILSKMDAGVERASRYDMIDDFAKRTGRPTDVSSDDRALARLSLRALYTSQMFRTLPEEAQLHPAMQERMFGYLPEMDEAVFGMVERMTSSTKEERTFVRR
ncbi:MAG: twin-arginine translocation signal domain-containing protein, partial [Deltaproteobacteria bacterium]|nr:twin-arginine translocation signal domain-containing protein [Deltaproteobacteria bacterium]